MWNAKSTRSVILVYKFLKVVCSSQFYIVYSVLGRNLTLIGICSVVGQIPRGSEMENTYHPYVWFTYNLDVVVSGRKIYFTCTLCIYLV